MLHFFPSVKKPNPITYKLTRQLIRKRVNSEVHNMPPASRFWQSSVTVQHHHPFPSSARPPVRVLGNFRTTTTRRTPSFRRCAVVVRASSTTRRTSSACQQDSGDDLANNGVFILTGCSLVLVHFGDCTRREPPDARGHAVHGVEVRASWLKESRSSCLFVWTRCSRLSATQVREAPLVCLDTP